MIAIVDDDACSRLAIETLLRAIGHCATGFSGGEAFLLRRKDFGCLITDLHMPGMSGLDLQRRLNGLEDPMPVIFISGFANKAAQRQAVLQGACAFLHKNDIAASLEPALAAALGGAL
tara:strand:+ start:196 stop:549 length:354 start_codon:yes stop_codon:yes gene_type:complete